MVGDWVPCGLHRPSSCHPRKQKEKPFKSLGARGRLPRPTTQETPPHPPGDSSVWPVRIVQEGGVGGLWYWIERVRAVVRGVRS